MQAYFASLKVKARAKWEEKRSIGSAPRVRDRGDYFDERKGLFLGDVNFV